MLRFIIRRLLLLVPILVGLSILVFVWVHALPGSPADALLGERSTPQLVERYKKLYGLDEPLYSQYYAYVKQMAKGDLGVSIATHRTVFEEIKEKFPVWSGTLVTAGDVAFYGTLDGWFKAVDIRAGRELWKFKVGSGVVGAPMPPSAPGGPLAVP